MKNLPTLIIVEDDVFMQTILNQCLSKQYHLTTFNNGIDAISFLQQGNIPDVIISDLNVPLLDGLQLIEQVKNSGFFNTVPIVILSGEKSTEKKIECLEAGAEDYIEKPFNPREIQARLRIILKRMGKLVNT
ncbi:MAG: response regulator transcription factor [Chitinophagaceae bacterium]